MVAIDFRPSCGITQTKSDDICENNGRLYELFCMDVKKHQGCELLYKQKSFTGLKSDMTYYSSNCSYDSHSAILGDRNSRIVLTQKGAFDILILQFIPFAHIICCARTCQHNY